MFQVGDILKIDVASRSHVTQPYYVEVLYFNKDAKRNGQIIMITSIPNEHDCAMELGGNWTYHYPRMTKVGTKKTHGDLLINQSLI